MKEIVITGRVSEVRIFKSNVIVFLEIESPAEYNESTIQFTFNDDNSKGLSMVNIAALPTGALIEVHRKNARTFLSDYTYTVRQMTMKISDKELF